MTDEHELEEHLQSYRNFLLKVGRWAAAPNSSEARELLEEHEALILDAGIDKLGRHLAHEAASSKPLRPGGGYSAAGVLAASAEILYVLGRAHLGDYAVPVVGDLLRMADGRGSLLALKIPRAKHPYDDIIDDLRERMILQADYLAKRDGGRWEAKVVYGVGERTLKRWAAMVPPEKHRKARLIGRLEGSQTALDPDQQSFRDYFLHYTMDELAYALRHPPAEA